MVRAAIILAEGFEELEAVTIVDVLRRAEVEAVMLGLTARQVTGNHGITLGADTTFEAAVTERWDVVVLPGGMPGAATLRDDARLSAFLRAQIENGGRVAAICAAPIALARAGLLDGRRATAYPTFRGELGSADYREDAVVIDGPVVTSRGPGTALTFALTLVELLRSPEHRAEVAKRMLIA